MNLKSIFLIILAILVGIGFGKFVITFGGKAIVLAQNSYEKFEDFELSQFVSRFSFSNSITTENDLIKKEQGGDFSNNQKSQNGNSIFVNPATDILESFPENDLGSFNQYSNHNRFSENLSVPNSGKVVVANLETMKLDLYKDGEIISTHEILSKGRPGTPWETPPGNFEVKYRTENHFSSIGEVWLPYSMQFFGNYFIHGWPYYPGGTPVAEGYSGGCIRLSDDDAKKVFDFAELRTKVIVLGTTQEEISSLQSGYYEVLDNNLPSAITSKSYLVADLDSGDVLFSKDTGKVMPIASITKLMTALISLETINQYRETFVSQRAFDTEGWRGNLSVGESILTGDLIFPLLLQSSNDASEVLAEFAGRNNFLNNMNVRAKSLDLKRTNFADPSGLSELNLSTATDLYKLVSYIFRYKRYIFEVTQMPNYENENHNWPNTSHFLGEDYYLGGKNGFTDEARHTLVTLVQLPIELERNIDKEDEADEKGASEFIPSVAYRRFAIIVLNAEKTVADTKAIVNHLQNNVIYIKK